MGAERPRFPRLNRDHAIQVLADYITRPQHERRRGDLAHAHLEVAAALRDLFDAAQASAARAVRDLEEELREMLGAAARMDAFRPPLPKFWIGGEQNGRSLSIVAVNEEEAQHPPGALIVDYEGPSRESVTGHHTQATYVRDDIATAARDHEKAEARHWREQCALAADNAATAQTARAERDRAVCELHNVRADLLACSNRSAAAQTAVQLYKQGVEALVSAYRNDRCLPHKTVGLARAAFNLARLIGGDSDPMWPESVRDTNERGTERGTKATTAPEEPPPEGPAEPAP